MQALYAYKLIHRAAQSKDIANMTKTCPFAQTSHGYIAYLVVTDLK